MPVAVITGASRGLGRALAAGLIDRGWEVIADARDADRLKAAGTALGARARPVPGDVRDPRHRADLVRAAAQLGGASLLVNNASSLGPSPLPPLADADPDALTEVHRTNVVAPTALTQALLPQLTDHAGAVLNVSSDAAVASYPGWGVYGSSKAALDQLTRTWAEERPDLRFWSVDPGDLRTAMHQDAYPGQDISDRPEPETVVPALLALIERRLSSGRYTAAQLASGAAA